MTLQEKQQHYLELMHALQSGVAYKMDFDPSDTSPKHLRVGVNSALIQQAALTELLVAKGIITDAEYMDKLLEKLEQEIADYEKELSARFGGAIRLG